MATVPTQRVRRWPARLARIADHVWDLLPALTFLALILSA